MIHVHHMHSYVNLKVKSMHKTSLQVEVTHTKNTFTLVPFSNRKFVVYRMQLQVDMCSCLIFSAYNLKQSRKGQSNKKQTQKDSYELANNKQKRST